MKTNRRNISILMIILSMLLLAGSADARSSYGTAWSGLYPSSTLYTTYGCDLCHGTPYYTDIKAQLGGQTSVNDSTISAAITAVEPVDSDGDGFTNIVEINSNTHPGLASSHPVTYAPAITGYSPSSPVNNVAGDERTFNVSLNQTANVTWLINGSIAQFNESVTEAKYTNKSAVEGTWNVTAFVQNPNGTAVQEWEWRVSAPPAEAPKITGHFPSSPIGNVAGDERTFNISVSQTVNVTWFINGSIVQFNESVSEARYTNKSAAEGTWNVTAYVQNANGTAVQEWEWIVSPPPTGAPMITAHSPSSPVNNVAGEERTFNISVNQTVNVTWFINGSMVQFNESVTEAKYTNKSAAAGDWNVTAVAENSYGTDSQKWDWIVSPLQSGAPKITGHSPSSPVSDVSGARRTFDVNINRTANVTWYINGSMVQFNESVTYARYTNASAATGTWNVTAVAENDFGADSQKWDWIVSAQSPSGAPKIISFYPASMLIYNFTGEPRTFGITIDNVANVTWYLYDVEMKGGEVHSDKGVTESSYTNPGISEGVWIIEAIAENDKGSDSLVWMWVVTPGSSAGDIEADVRIKPETLNLDSHGKMTVSITLPSEYDAENIDVDSVTLEGAHPVGKTKKVKHNTLKLKFNVQDLENVSTGEHVTLTVTGNVLDDGKLLVFEGSDTVRVIESGKIEEDDEDELEEDDHDDDEIEEDVGEDEVKEEDHDEDEQDGSEKVSVADSAKKIKVESKVEKQKEEKEKKVKGEEKDKKPKKIKANGKEGSAKKEDKDKKVKKSGKKSGKESDEDED